MKKQHKTISFVPQEPCIFAATVWENLCMGSFIRSATIDKACKMANIFDFIQTLPEVSRKQLKGPTFCTKYRQLFFQKFETKIGDGGVQISTGQKQRLAIARALLCQPEIFVFGEITSALDPENEALVQKSIESVS